MLRLLPTSIGVIVIAAAAHAIDPPTLEPPHMEPPRLDAPSIDAPHMSASDVADMSTTRTPNGTLTPAPTITAGAGQPRVTVHPYRAPAQ